MTSLIPYIAGVAGSICYGVATVFEQHGAKKEDQIKDVNPLNLIRLAQQKFYFLGLFLDLLGWVFFLYAVRILPLFLVESFIALSILFSALLDHYWLQHKVRFKEKISILSVVVGITFLSIIAKPSTVTATGNIFKYCVIIGPILIAIFGTYLAKQKATKFNTSIIAILTGLAFGGTSIATRIISFNNLGKQYIQIFILLSLIIYGVLGVILLSIALQRERVNRVNSLVIASEVIIPSLIGLIFLKDGVKGNHWFVMSLGLLLVLFGTLFTTSRVSNYANKNKLKT